MFTDADFEEKIDAAVAVSGEFLPPPGAQFEGQLVRLRFFRDEAEIGEKVNIYGPKTPARLPTVRANESCLYLEIKHV
jgi:hypothetical protein